MLTWQLLHPKMTAEALGLLPLFLFDHDPRPAREQLNERYCSGWTPQPKFTLSNRGLEYPGDPPMRPLAETRLRDEVIRLYEGDWVAIIQPDGSFEVDRMD